MQKAAKNVIKGWFTVGEAQSHLMHCRLCSGSSIIGNRSYENSIFKVFRQPFSVVQRQNEWEIGVENKDDKKVKWKGPTKKNQLSGNGTLLSNMMLKVKSRKTRLKSGLILLEGKRLINDICAAGIIPSMVFFSNNKDVEELNIPKETNVYKVPYKELQLWSDLTTSPGIIAFCKVPDIINESEDSLPITVICDQIREPGNLGCIIRNSAGVGVSRIILTSGCTDLWDSKVLRAGAGAHFRVPVMKDETWENIPEVLPQRTTVLLADTVGGNKEFLSQTRIKSLPIVPYYSFNYTRFEHLAIVVGGETEGLSDDAVNLAQKLNGSRITIPMSNCIDSLNSAVAVSVILFEMKRQISVGNDTSVS